MNFAWVYSREAHPENSPFARGFETRDLGWNHPYFRPSTMEERAQRARWLKMELEPDGEIPILIDYINSPLGSDNAIWKFYIGGGFYTGFIIDCDGMQIQGLSWAWLEPGGQWFALPLAPFRNLVDFLDEYLANPPACYVPAEGPPVQDTLPTPETASDEQAGLPTILIVDDDQGRFYEGYFKLPLGTLKQHYQIWDVQADGSPTSDTLASFEAVVWLTGDSTHETLTQTDQDNLAAYLDGGGRLVLSGQHIGQDIGDTLFYRDYLHATLIHDETDVNVLLGEDILRGMWVTLAGVDGANNQDGPSRIGLLDGAKGVFRYDTLSPPVYAGLRWAGDYQVVYLSFGLEGIGDGGAGAFRFRIMKGALAWFGLLGDLDSDNDKDLDDFSTFARCMRGVAHGLSPSCSGGDIDGDWDADLDDFSAFQRAFGGPK